MGKQRAHNPVHTKDVDVVNRLDLFGRKGFVKSHATDASVVDQHVDVAAQRKCSSDARSNTCFIGYVQLDDMHAQALSAELAVSAMPAPATTEVVAPMPLYAEAG